MELLSVFPDTKSIEDLMDKYSLRWDPHLDVAGHRRWAEVLVDLCEAEGYLPR